MRLDAIDRLQAGIWARHGEAVEVVDAGGAVQWSGLAVAEVPEGEVVPGLDGANYEEPIRRLVFRRADVPRLPRGSRIRWRGTTWAVDQTHDRSDESTAVTLGPPDSPQPEPPPPPPPTPRRAFSRAFGPAFG